MDDRPRSNPPPPPESSLRLIAILRPEPGNNRPGVEEMVAALVNSAHRRNESRAEPDDWVTVDEAYVAPETAAAVENLSHSYDEYTAQNRQRVEERDRASACPPASQAATQLPSVTDAAQSRIRDLEQEIRRAMLRCRNHPEWSIHFIAEVIDVSLQTIPLPSHESSGEE